ncbi:MAG: 5-(carboxyamino)imidazole ribonucleotide synthase [Pyrinomonadaceae bacterium]|nr:5-(carboxyamino)imidazole ribonucleotide synthase [Pyrinomonadaceae bacterium]MCX7640035.1 5-(carboxyamino)imidazole ribonucleotide synthase [Pyrinomonadaceae bacterium]MDW8304207.1 5-(carboxyamino)imidazole ribonucleotide synthase [Acidobacteriota bacterium]
MKQILPGATIGIFGSGQLGRMFAIEARKMGYRVHTFSPDKDTPTGQVANIETTADYLDSASIREFAKSVDVITFEFENVPVEAIEIASKYADVHPKAEILYTTQNRLREKTFLRRNAFPHADFFHIKTLEDLNTATEKIGFPCVLKTAGFGYDGKGQTKIHSPAEIEKAFQNLKGQEGILEAFIDFQKEISVVCARDQKGNFSHYGVIENKHKDHILDTSFAPSPISERIKSEAIEIARSIAEIFDYVGTLCVEFFLTKNEKVIVNEIAPRPHNSGHLTFDACVTSQFEQQLRAVCGLNLGSTEMYKPAAMANLLGDLWRDGEPDWPKALQHPNLKLHIYGKTEARPRRKMGHLTALADSPEVALKTVVQARRNLSQEKL